LAPTPPAAPQSAHPLPTAEQVRGAIRYTYAQMMLNAVFGASTGGMFLVGFAMALGADNLLLGVITTVPQFFILFQFAAAGLIERGWSRKKMTLIFSCIAPLCWVLVAAIPLLGNALNASGRIAVLISVICLVTLAGQFSAAARGSWVGELIPAEQRGRFFGYCTMFAGIVGALFAVAEGRFLDVIQGNGLLAFAALFFFGSVFGLASGLLHWPQPDCALPHSGPQPGFFRTLRDTLRLRPFVALALVHAVIAMGGIAGPFVAAYCLRDLRMTYFGLGLLNAVGTAAVLITSPLWGRLADRFGCRPLLVLGLAVMAPCGLIWLVIPPGARDWGYWLLPWTNFIAGAGSAAVSVAISTLVYKTSTPQGRSIQFAAYGVFVTLVAAPMPLLGGWLVTHLEGLWRGVDLRLTFYLWTAFMCVAAWLAWRLKEPGSAATRAVALHYIPRRLASRVGVDLTPVYRLLPDWANVPLPRSPEPSDPPREERPGA
jgi:MFS family permease